MGEVFDELYTQTGVQGTTDSIIQYDAQLDSKMDDDETVCVHVLDNDIYAPYRHEAQIRTLIKQSTCPKTT